MGLIPSMESAEAAAPDPVAPSLERPAALAAAAERVGVAGGGGLAAALAAAAVA